MIWQSVGLMTALDLAIFGISVGALWVVVKRRAELEDAGKRGPSVVALGLLAIGLFYLTDLFSMWVLPVLTTPERAQRAMEALHLEYNWIVTLLVAAIVLLGLKSTVQGLSHQSAELKERAERYRSLYEKTPFMLHSLDLQSNLVSVSDTWLKTLGYERKEVIGRPAKEFLTPKSWEYTEEVCLPKFKETGVLEDIELEFRRKDGQIVDVLLSAVAERDSSGAFVRSLSASKDVTELTRARAKLEKLRKHNELILESAGEGIYGLDQEGMVTFVNQAATRLFGWEPEELMGKSMHNVLHHTKPDGRPYTPEECPIYAAFMDGKVHRVSDEVFWHKNGSSFAVDYTSTPIEQNGHLLGAVVVFRDITEQRVADLQRQKAFEEVARLKDELESERDYLREEVDVSFRFGEIVGDSAALKKMLAQIDAVADTDATVLVQGETGVGKELVARAVHKHSSRSGPLVKVNCASIPRDLFESEFFGHIKGAFTGAHKDRDGRFQLANNGTLFLDEVGETPLELQGKLLRVLEEGEFERVGEAVTRRVDVRLITATNRDLKREVEAGRFREDLYFRLSVFPLKVPPLSERREDVVPLATHFLEMACSEFGRHDLALSRFQAEALRRYDWPGNVRELRNVIERAVILSPTGRLRLDLALPGLVQGAEPTASEKTAGKTGFLTASEFKRLERENLIAALEHANWKIAGESGAARMLELKPPTLRYQMKKLGINRPGASGP